MNHFSDVDWSSIPAPVDDGATDHLLGRKMPPIALESTGGEPVNLAALSGTLVIYAYPMTAKPGVALPDDWDSIPGARGCTPQSCAFRDHAAELKEQGVDTVFGLSTQSREYQTEAATRLKLPFLLLSDMPLALTKAMTLPTFDVAGMTLLRRFTLVVKDGFVSKVFYPVFPPDSNASAVVEWLRSSRT